MIKSIGRRQEIVYSDQLETFVPYGKKKFFFEGTNSDASSFIAKRRNLL